MERFRFWIKPVITLVVLLVIAYWLPNSPMDPWGLINLKKMISMIFALILVQSLGLIFAEVLGVKAGAVLTGFIGGLISSTATTASLARQSKKSISSKDPIEAIIFLTATAAMLFEGVLLILIGQSKIEPSFLLLFLGPLSATLIMVIFQSQGLYEQNLKNQQGAFKILPILKLAIFIFLIITFSKILQRSFGEKSLLIITFFVSLFEVHGPIIANIHMYDTESFDKSMLGNLIATSILASYLSKLFLVFIFGSRVLKIKSSLYTGFLVLSLALSWFVFIVIN